MTDRDRLERRLDAVERSLTGDEQALDALAEAGELERRVEELEATLDATAERVAELEAATQALRGYVGNVRSVNEDVAQRADAALAAVDRLEERVEPESQQQDPLCQDSSPRPRPTADGGSPPSAAGGPAPNPDGQSTPAARSRIEADLGVSDDRADTGSDTDGDTGSETDGDTDESDGGVLDRLTTRL